MLRSKILLVALAAIFIWSACPQSAQAGPLLNWFRGMRKPRASSCCQTAPSPTCPTPQVANASGLQPGQCMKTCYQTCSRTVVNYVPCTAYRTAWNRVPVTQYKPVTSSDPATGCTVTCMKPCTTYTWQMKREPYTTYRPVYRQETYKVPVTTITNDCATGGCTTGCSTGYNPAPSGMAYNPAPSSSCSSCQTGVAPMPANPQAIYPSNSPQPVQGEYYTVPNNGATITPTTPNSGFQVPADAVPVIESSINPQNSQRPVINRFDSSTSNSGPPVEGPLQTGTGVYGAPLQNNVQSVSDPAIDTTTNEGWINSAPRYVPAEDMTAQAPSPIRKRWSYSPVRLASYTTVSDNTEPVAEPIAAAIAEPVRITGHYQPAIPAVKNTTQQPQQNNAGWETVEW